MGLHSEHPKHFYGEQHAMLHGTDCQRKLGAELRAFKTHCAWTSQPLCLYLCGLPPPSPISSKNGLQVQLCSCKTLQRRVSHSKLPLMRFPSSLPKTHARLNFLSQLRCHKNSKNLVCITFWYKLNGTHQEESAVVCSASCSGFQTSPVFFSRAAVSMFSELLPYSLLSSHTFGACILSCVWALVANFIFT